LTSKIFN